MVRGPRCSGTGWRITLVETVKTQPTAAGGIQILTTDYDLATARNTSVSCAAI